MQLWAGSVDGVTDFYDLYKAEMLTWLFFIINRLQF